MWAIEIGFTYTNVVSRLLFDTREEAETERNKLLPFLGKDRLDLRQNGAMAPVSLKDKYGTLDVVVSDVKMVRCFDMLEWNNMVTKVQTDINNAHEQAKLGK